MEILRILTQTGAWFIPQQRQEVECEDLPSRKHHGIIWLHPWCLQALPLKYRLPRTGGLAMGVGHLRGRPRACYKALPHRPSYALCEMPSLTSQPQVTPPLVPGRASTSKRGIRSGGPREAYNVSRTILREVRRQSQTHDRLIAHSEFDLSPRSPPVGTAEEAAFHTSEKGLIGRKAWRDSQTIDVEVQQPEVPPRPVATVGS